MNEQPTVLVIDDSLTNVVLIDAILKRENFTVLRAFSVDEAFRILKINSVDLIILDIMFPGKDGREFLKQRLQKETILSIPVIVTSAISNEQEIKEILELKAEAYFKKPLEINTFLLKAIELTSN